MPNIIIDGLNQYYEITGNGVPLVLIHGLGSSCQDWELQVDSFARYYQVITIDLRGHGRSGKPQGPYSIPLFARDTAGLLNELNCTPAHILGISLGGMVAFQLAIDFPNVTRSLIIVNSTPDLIPKTLKDHLGIWQRFLIVRFMGLRRLGEVLGDRFFPDPEQSVLRNIFIERWAENNKPAYMEAMKAVVGWSVLERLGEITAPTLVIGADGDYFSTAEKEMYVKLIPNARLEIVKDARHALPAEKPEIFNAIVQKFLRRLPVQSV